MSFNALPPELFMRLPYFLDSIEDVLALSSTSCALYRTCANPPPRALSRLAANSGRIFFRPHPHLLIAATARELANWAVQATERRFRLEEAIQGGVDELLELAIAVVGLTMDDLRRLWRYKSDVLNPLDRELDVEIGPASDIPWTVCNDPAMTLVSWIIYGELFHHSHSLGYLPMNDVSTTRRPLSSVTRYKWFVYCMPDENCFHYLDYTERPQFFLDYEQEETDRFQQLSMQTAMHSGILSPVVWDKRLSSAPLALAAYDGLQPRARPGLWKIFVRRAMHLGFRSLELLLPGGPGGPERLALAEDLQRLAAQLVDALPVKPDANPYSTPMPESLQAFRDAELRAKVPRLLEDPWWSSGFPGLEDDMRFTSRGIWSDQSRVGELKEAVRSPAKPGAKS